jgi:hypothetical protein
LGCGDVANPLLSLRNEPDARTGSELGADLVFALRPIKRMGVDLRDSLNGVPCHTSSLYNVKARGDESRDRGMPEIVGCQAREIVAVVQAFDWRNASLDTI